MGRKDAVGTCEVEQEVVESGGDARGHFADKPGRRHALCATAHDAQIAPCQRQIATQLVPCITGDLHPSSPLIAFIRHLTPCELQA